MKKILIFILLLIIILTASLLVFKNTLATNYLIKIIKDQTDLDSIAEVNVHILTQSLNIKDLKIYNPKGFKDKLMMDVPEIFFKCNIIALLNKTINIENARLNLNKLNVIKNSDGKVNIDALKQLAKTDKIQQSEEEIETPKINIIKLHLKVGNVTYKDCTQAPPDLKEFKVNLDEEIKDIQSIDELVNIVTKKAIYHTTINKLLEMDLEELKKQAIDILNDPGNKEKIEDTKKQLKELFKEELEKLNK